MITFAALFITVNGAAELSAEVQCRISRAWLPCWRGSAPPLVASRLRIWTVVLPMSSLSRPAWGIFSESCRHQSGISWAAYPHSQPILHTDLITLFALLFIHTLAGFIFAWTPSLNNALFSLIGWLYNMCRRWGIVQSRSKGKRGGDQKAGEMGWKNGATESGGDKKTRARTRTPLTYLYKAVEMAGRENLWLLFTDLQSCAVPWLASPLAATFNFMFMAPSVKPISTLPHSAR